MSTTPRPGVEPSPCFSIFLARTTFVLESLPEAKNPGQDAIFEDFVFNSSNRTCTLQIVGQKKTLQPN